MDDSKRVEFVDFKGFLDSSRSMGLSFDDGVRELVDNSIDSGAQNIRIMFENTDKGGIKVTVEDDGSGIPLTFENDDGVIKYGIPFVMAFGNKGIFDVIADGSRKRIGRFGYGLSTTISCLTKEDGSAEIWSRRREDSEWRMCYYKYSELVKDENLTLPAEKSFPFPQIITRSNHGTIVILEITDPEVTSVSHMQTRFLKFIGRTYRNHLSKGINVEVVSKNKSGKMLIKNVRMKDPLCLLPGSEEVEKFGFARKYEPIIIEFDGTNQFDDYTTEDGYVPKISVIISRLNKTIVMNALENDIAGLNPVEIDKVLARWNIGRNGQGFSLLREGRELDMGKTLGIYSKTSLFNYMHGSINFDSQLDRVFNVRTNKSRYSIANNLRVLLTERIEETLWKVMSDHREEIKFEKELASLLGGESEAEKLAREAAIKLPTPSLSDDESKAAMDMRLESKTIQAEKAKEIVGALFSRVFADIEEKKKSGDKDGQKTAELVIVDLQKKLEDWIKKIEKRFSSRVPVRIDHGVLNDGSVYDVEDRGDEAKIIVNTESKFFPGIYNIVNSDKQLKTVLDLMIMSLGYSEFIHLKEEPHMLETWVEARREVSTHLLNFVSEMQKEVA